MKKKLSILILFILSGLVVIAQDADTINAITSSSSSAQQFAKDTLAKQDVSPLDISADRGL